MRSVVVVLAAGLFAVGLAHAQDVASGEKVFLQCKACHQIGETAKNGVGPVLNGLFGRKSGTIEGFNYSAANKDAGARGLVWTEQVLLKYLEAPLSFMPGTKMAFAGLKDPQDCKDVVAYLKTFAK